MTGQRGNRRGGGRKARLAARAAPPPVDPCPPGQAGGQYRPLRESEITAVYATALRLLAKLGMGEVPDNLAQVLDAGGCTDNGKGRWLFPRSLVEDVIDRAAKTFPLHGRDPDRSIEVGGDRVWFGTGGAAVQTLDLERGTYRPSTLRDLHDFTRLQDALANIAWFTRCCIATDVTDARALDINTAYALIANTTKPVATAFTLAEHVDPIVEMFDIAAGGPGEFAPSLRQSPYQPGHIADAVRRGCGRCDICLPCAQHPGIVHHRGAIRGHHARNHGRVPGAIAGRNAGQPGDGQPYQAGPSDDLLELAAGN